MKHVALALFMLAAPALADDAATALGKGLAEANCRTCHAISTTDLSTLANAPAFRDIALNYDLLDLEDALNEGVPVDHTIMPDWQMTPEQAHALASYIMSLAPAGKLKSEAVPRAQPGLAANP